jgi:hypothetical protein
MDSAGQDRVCKSVKSRSHVVSPNILTRSHGLKSNLFSHFRKKSFWVFSFFGRQSEISRNFFTLHESLCLFSELEDLVQTTVFVKADLCVKFSLRRNRHGVVGAAFVILQGYRG